MKKLRAYFQKYGVKINAFCRSTGICRASMYSILGGKDPSLAQAIAIEEISQGHVTVEDWVREAKAKKRKSETQSRQSICENQDLDSQIDS